MSVPTSPTSRRWNPAWVRWQGWAYPLFPIALGIGCLVFATQGLASPGFDKRVHVADTAYVPLGKGNWIIFAPEADGATPPVELVVHRQDGSEVPLRPPTPGELGRHTPSGFEPRYRLEVERESEYRFETVNGAAGIDLILEEFAWYERVHPAFMAIAYLIGIALICVGVWWFVWLRRWLKAQPAPEKAGGSYATSEAWPPLPSPRIDAPASVVPVNQAREAPPPPPDVRPPPLRQRRFNWEALWAPRARFLPAVLAVLALGMGVLLLVVDPAPPFNRRLPVPGTTTVELWEGTWVVFGPEGSEHAEQIELEVSRAAGEAVGVRAARSDDVGRHRPSGLSPIYAFRIREKADYRIEARASELARTDELVLAEYGTWQKAPRGVVAGVGGVLILVGCGLVYLNFWIHRRVLRYRRENPAEP